MAVRRTPLDGRAVLAGAAVAVAVAVPPAALVRVVKGGDLDGQESYLWVLPVVALLVGFALGGHLAARRRPDAPLRHSAAAAAAGFGAIAAFTVVRRLAGGEGLSATVMVNLVLLLQITVSLAVLGGYLATRRGARV